MFRRIGKFIEDIAETIKRERGNLKIIDHKTGDSIRMDVRKSEILNESSITMLSPDNPADTLVLNTLEDDAPVPEIMGEEDHSPPPGFYSEDIIFDVLLPERHGGEISGEYEVEVDDVRVKQDALVLGNTDVKAELSGLFELKNEQLQEAKFNIEEYDEMKFDFYHVDNSELRVTTTVLEKESLGFGPVQLKNLDSEFLENQERYFHFEESVDFYGKILDYETDFSPLIKDTLAAATHFPIKRPPVSKSGYQVDEIKKALTFIIEKFESKGKLKIIGIYKNVPIYSAQKLTFTKDKCLLFYYRKKTDQKVTTSKPFMLDVLVVKSREGKYHVGPIIRTA